MKNSWAPLVLAVVALAVEGCAIAEKSDKFGADLELGVGGLLGEFVDLKLKAQVGFSKTCFHGEEDGDAATESGRPRGAAGPRGFL